MLTLAGALIEWQALEAPTGPRKARRDDKLRAVPTRSFTEASGLFGRVTDTNASPLFPQLCDVVFAGVVAHK
jgi:hypothetical protein